MKIHAENAESARDNGSPATTRCTMDGGKRCRKQACRLTALVGEYCEHHALQKHENMVNKPDLYMYLNESTHRSKLQSWFVQNDDTINVNRMLLWYAIHNFKSCSSPELRKSRSKTIYKKFLCETSKYRVRVHERVEKLCLSSFEKYSFIPSEVLYQVQGAVFLSLERIFLNIYVSSQDFQVFAESQKNMILKTKFSTVDPKTTRRGLWSLPGDIFRSNSSEKKKTSNMECYRIQTNSEANADPKSTRTSRSKTASSFFAQKDESKNKWKLSSEKFSRPSDVLDPLYDTERSSSTRHSHLNLGLKSMNLVPRSAKGRDSGLLITPRSSRLEEMDDASAALILASYGSNVARRTT